MTINDRIGSWLSAALDGPNVFDEMKADIREWMDTQGWQPIETAPRDARAVLLLDEFGPPRLGFWGCRTRAWLAAEGTGELTQQPTHVMPMPPPPEVKP
jgi:hypothetical protein